MEEFLNKWLFDDVTGKLISALIGIIIVVSIVKFLQRSIGQYVRDSTTRYRARKGITFLGYVVAVALLAAIFSEKLAGLTVALGVAGAGIAFALQEVIASIAGWVAISFGNFYRPGDRVQLGGIKGDVIDIGVLRTTLMEMGQWVSGDNYNGRIVRVANSFVFKEPVFNYSADFPFLWDEIKFPLRYGSDWRMARTMLENVVNEVVGDFAARSKDAWKEVVQKYKIEDARIDPIISMQANDNWIEFTVRYIVDYQSRRVTKDRLFTRILEEVDASGKRIEIASATFELTAAPDIKIRLQSHGQDLELKQS